MTIASAVSKYRRCILRLRMEPGNQALGAVVEPKAEEVEVLGT